VHTDDLRELLQSRPFRPFRLVLSNNATYEIRHPEFAVLTRRLLQITLTESSETDSGEEFVGVALVHIVQYQILPSPAAAAPQGENPA
jgi:hypothetical protein